MMPKSIQSPGTVLKLFLRGYQLNPTSLAKHLKLSQATVRLLALDKTKISVHVALRLAKFFSMTPEYWLNLQNKYDLSLAGGNKKLAGVLKSIPKARKPSAAGIAGREKKTAKEGSKAKTGAKRGPKPGGAVKGGRARSAKK
jgi:addiction module HigA family antidote